MNLSEILKEQPLNNSRHDRIIRELSGVTQISPNVMTIFMNAYYKIHGKEGDIDLLQIWFDADKYFFDDWKEIPANDCKLLLYEMKTGFSARNYTKAIKQLVKSKNVIQDLTDYQEVDCFFAYGVGNSIAWKYKKI